MKALGSQVVVILLGLVAWNFASAQTTISASVYGAFHQSANGNNTDQSQSNAAGGIFELRRIANPLVGYEVSYSFNRANQAYAQASYPCPVEPLGGCVTSLTAAIPANAHEITGDWLVSLKAANLRPFALAGGGLLLNVPSGGTVTTVTSGGCEVCAASPGSTTTTSAAATSTSTQGVFVYGAGLDWRLLPRIGLRLQYRGNLSKASALANAFSSTNAFTHTAEPMIGLYFRL